MGYPGCDRRYSGLQSGLLVRRPFPVLSDIPSSLNSTADWVFGTIPILIVRDLQMNLKTKAIVATLLGFAAVGSTATIVRMPYVWQLGDAKGEFLYETVELAIWSTVELGVGLIAASAATLRPLWQRFLAATGFSLSSNLSKPTMKKVPSFVTPIRPTNLDADGIQFEQLSRRDERATTTTTVTGNPSRKSKHKDTGYFNSLSSKSSYGRGQHTSATRSGNHSICDSHNLSTHASGDRDEGFFVWRIALGLRSKASSPLRTWTTRAGPQLAVDSREVGAPDLTRVQRVGD
ncbi:hypothetical protein M8818_007832 [Zalaria obscura]|uniref:Uncharacterized protein n=1 Tax=Zalaria obscura TaxID=2024903 RepID=A0ACC3S5D0_9PEZI